LVVCSLSAVTVLAASPGAFALAATAPATPPPLLDTLAGQLHVPPAQLEAAVRKAELARLEAFTRGRDLPADQIQAVRERIEKAPLRLAARFGHPQHPILTAAAAYLGLTPLALATELQQGKSLAEVAQQHGKTREGLKAAILTTLQTELNKRSDLTPDARIKAMYHFTKRVDHILDRHPLTGDRQVSAG
jgi:hypothetical protein